MPRISAVLIVKNEVERLAACLAALRPVADEIIVADTGSTDGTLDLARQFTPLCHEIPWEDDFAAARNRALDFATGDWVLSIDADEVIREPVAARSLLMGFATEQPDGATGTIRHISPTGADGAVVTGTVERFFPRTRFRFDGAIHEQLKPVDGLRGPLAETGLVVDHGGYGGLADEKGARNLPLLQKAAAEHPDDIYYRYQLGKTHFACKQYAEALAAFDAARRGIDWTSPMPLDHGGLPVGREALTTLIVSLAYALVNVGRVADAEALLTAHEALGHPGTQWADFHHVRGYVALMRGDILRAKAAYGAALGFGAAREDVAGTGGYASAYHLGLLAEAEQDLIGAIGHYATSLQMKPDYRVTLERYVDLMLEHRIGVVPNIQRHAEPEAFRGVFLEKLEARLDKGAREDAEFLTTAAGLLGATNKHLAGDLLTRCQRLQSTCGLA